MGVGVACVLDVQFLFLSIKGNWICAMTLHHADSNINIIWTRNLPIDSGVRQWSYRLMKPLHCLWAKSNNRARVQFEFYGIWFCFCFDFVRSQVRYSCCYIAFWRGWGVHLKLDIQGQGGGEISDVDGQGNEKFWKLDNSRERHMSIVP